MSLMYSQYWIHVWWFVALVSIWKVASNSKPSKYLVGAVPYALTFLLIVPSVSAVWEANNDINASLPPVTHPTFFLKDGTWYMLDGRSSGAIYGYNWTDGVGPWQADSNINASLPGTGPQTAQPYAFYLDGTLQLLIGRSGGVSPEGFNWTDGVGPWQADPFINASLPTSASAPGIFIMDGVLYNIDNSFNGFNWTDGVGPWQADSNINASLPTGGLDGSDPHVFFKDGAWYLLSQTTGVGMMGHNWTGSQWQADSNINATSTGDVGGNNVFVFQKDTELYAFVSGEKSFKWKQTPIPDAPLISHPPNNTITNNATILLNASCIGCHADLNFCWFNNSELITCGDTPIDDTMLVGAWHMEEGDGNSWIENTNLTLDYSGNGNGGEIFGSEYVRGRFEKGMGFNKIDNYIDITSALDDIQTSTQGTFTFWLRTEDATPSVTTALIGVGDTNANELMHIKILTSGVLQASLTDSGASDWDLRTSSQAFTDNEWHQVALVQNGTEPVLYVDGVRPTQAFLTDTDTTEWMSALAGIDNFLIGARSHSGSGPTSFYGGDMDEVRVYNRSLSASEMFEEYELALGNFNWTHSGVEQKYNISVVSSDSYTNSSTTSITLKIGTAPLIEYISETPANNSEVGMDWFVVNVSSDDAITEGLLDLDGVNSSMICVTINATFSHCFKNNTGLIDGNHTYKVFMNNTADIASETGNRTVVINAVAPEVSIFSPENITYNDTNIFLIANSTSVDTDSFFYWINSGGVNVTQNFTYIENVSIKSLIGISRVYELFVWVNDTGNNANQTSVVFTVNSSNQSNITILPDTPPSGGGGGYDVDLNFTVDATAAATVDAYTYFPVRANVFINLSSITLGTPVIRFSVDNVVVGSFNLHYVSGAGNNVTYQRQVKLPPASYAYYVEVLASNGITYFSNERFINVRVPASENITNVTLPASAFFGLLVTFTEETTPKSHSRVEQTNGIFVSGLALNVNGTLSNATLFILNEAGTVTLSSTNLDFSDNGNNTWSIFGNSALPENITRIIIQLGVIDSGGSAAYSVSRKIIVLPEDETGILKTSLFPFLNPFGDEEGENGISNGRIFAATLIMVVLIGGLYASGAGTLPAVAFGIMMSIEFATFGFIPTWVSILGMVLLGMIMMKSVLAMWLRR